MRALVLSSVYPSSTRPTFGTFVHERIRHVAALCEVVVVSPIPWFPANARWRGEEVARTPRVEQRDGLTVYHPRFLSVPAVAKAADALLYALCIRSLLQSIRPKFRFDLIDAHFAYPDGVAGALLSASFGCPLLITVRGDEARLRRYPLRRLQMRWALRRARIITVSASLSEVAAEIAGIGRLPVRVIPNGIDTRTFHPRDRTAARMHLGLPQDRRILLSVGALIERKGQHRVLEVLPDLLARHPDLLYVIVGGDGGGKPIRALVEALVQRHRLAEQVRLVPPQVHGEIAQWMSAADLFCLATSWEGWCNALMEALACGLPVVTTHVGGNAEFVEPGVDGALVPYWDGAAFVTATEAALARPWDRAAIAARAAARDWHAVARDVVDEYRRALQQVQ
ncbi:glycosyltransferase [Candidatus Binatia bacterium]|nr:glycosyltransferase [Candidatus Binatia bacterium]